MMNFKLMAQKYTGKNFSLLRTYLSKHSIIVSSWNITEDSIYYYFEYAVVEKHLPYGVKVSRANGKIEEIFKLM